MTGSEPSSPSRTRRVKRVQRPARPSGSTWRRGSRAAVLMPPPAGPPGPFAAPLPTPGPLVIAPHDLLPGGVLTEVVARVARPGRAATMRSATSKMFARLWLMTMTARPRSLRRRMRSSTWRVWATPRAAVGSSRITSFGSPSSERAMATIWRWPPDSDATGVVTLGMRDESDVISSTERCSMAVSSRSVHRAERALAGTPRGRGTGCPRRRGCRRARGPGRRSRCRARSRPAGRVMWTGSPRKRNSPLSARPTPEMVLISVDFPAPLSPTRATTSPASMLEVHVRERLDRAEALVDPLQLKYGNAHEVVLLSARTGRAG